MVNLDDLTDIAGANEFDEAPEVGDGYQDPLPPAPVPAGNYRVALDIELDRDKDGRPNLSRGVWPVVLIKKATVVEGPQGTEGRTAVSFERVYSVPFDRNGTKASGLGDFTRALDTTITYRDPREGIKAAAEAVEQGMTAQCRIDWEAYDKDYYEQLCNEQGSEAMCSDEQKKRFRKEATIKGMRNFPLNADGTRSHLVKGKSGQYLEARARIASWYPSTKEVKIG